MPPPPPSSSMRTLNSSHRSSVEPRGPPEFNREYARQLSLAKRGRSATNPLGRSPLPPDLPRGPSASFVYRQQQQLLDALTPTHSSGESQSQLSEGPTSRPFSVSSAIRTVIMVWAAVFLIGLGAALIVSNDEGYQRDYFSGSFSSEASVASTYQPTGLDQWIPQILRQLALRIRFAVREIRTGNTALVLQTMVEDVAGGARTGISFMAKYAVVPAWSMAKNVAELSTRAPSVLRSWLSIPHYSILTNFVMDRIISPVHHTVRVLTVVPARSMANSTRAVFTGTWRSVSGWIAKPRSAPLAGGEEQSPATPAAHMSFLYGVFSTMDRIWLWCSETASSIHKSMTAQQSSLHRTDVKMQVNVTHHIPGDHWGRLLDNSPGVLLPLARNELQNALQLKKPEGIRNVALSASSLLDVSFTLDRLVPIFIQNESLGPSDADMMSARRGLLAETKKKLQDYVFTDLLKVYKQKVEILKHCECIQRVQSLPDKSLCRTDISSLCDSPIPSGDQGLAEAVHACEARVAETQQRWLDCTTEVEELQQQQQAAHHDAEVSSKYAEKMEQLESQRADCERKREQLLADTAQQRAAADAQFHKLKSSMREEVDAVKQEQLAAVAESRASCDAALEAVLAEGQADGKAAINLLRSEKDEINAKFMNAKGLLSNCEKKVEDKLQELDHQATLLEAEQNRCINVVKSVNASCDKQIHLSMKEGLAQCDERVVETTSKMTASCDEQLGKLRVEQEENLVSQLKQENRKCEQQVQSVEENSRKELSEAKAEVTTAKKELVECHSSVEATQMEVVTLRSSLEAAEGTSAELLRTLEQQQQAHAEAVEGMTSKTSSSCLADQQENERKHKLQMHKAMQSAAQNCSSRIAEARSVTEREKDEAVLLAVAEVEQKLLAECSVKVVAAQQNSSACVTSSKELPPQQKMDGKALSGAIERMEKLIREELRERCKSYPTTSACSTAHPPPTAAATMDSPDDVLARLVLLHQSMESLPKVAVTPSKSTLLARLRSFIRLCAVAIVVGCALVYAFRQRDLVSFLQSEVERLRQEAWRRAPTTSTANTSPVVVVDHASSSMEEGLHYAAANYFETMGAWHWACCSHILEEESSPRSMEPMGSSSPLGEDGFVARHRGLGDLLSPPASERGGSEGYAEDKQLQQQPYSVSHMRPISIGNELEDGGDVEFLAQVPVANDRLLERVSSVYFRMLESYYVDLLEAVTNRELVEEQLSEMGQVAAKQSEMLKHQNEAVAKLQNNLDKHRNDARRVEEKQQAYTDGLQLQLSKYYETTAEAATLLESADEYKSELEKANGTVSAQREMVQVLEEQVARLSSALHESRERRRRQSMSSSVGMSPAISPTRSDQGQRYVGTPHQSSFGASEPPRPPSAGRTMVRDPASMQRYRKLDWLDPGDE